MTLRIKVKKLIIMNKSWIQTKRKKKGTSKNLKKRLKINSNKSNPTKRD